MICHGFAVSTSPGTAVRLCATRMMASFVTIFPRILNGTPNVGQVRIGGMPGSKENITLNGTITSIPSGTGMPISPGDAGVIWPMNAPAPVDVSLIYMDVDNSGDGVQFIFGRP